MRGRILYRISANKNNQNTDVLQMLAQQRTTNYAFNLRLCTFVMLELANFIKII